MSPLGMRSPILTGRLRASVHVSAAVYNYIYNVHRRGMVNVHIYIRLVQTMYWVA